MPLTDEQTEAIRTAFATAAQGGKKSAVLFCESGFYAELTEEELNMVVGALLDMEETAHQMYKSLDAGAENRVIGTLRLAARKMRNDAHALADRFKQGQESIMKNSDLKSLREFGGAATNNTTGTEGK